MSPQGPRQIVPPIHRRHGQHGLGLTYAYPKEGCVLITFRPIVTCKLEARYLILTPLYPQVPPWGA